MIQNSGLNSEFQIHIYDQQFKNFLNNDFETAEFWYFVGLTASLCLL